MLQMSLFFKEACVCSLVLLQVMNVQKEKTNKQGTVEEKAILLGNINVIWSNDSVNGLRKHRERVHTTRCQHTTLK